jgi:hypothetical protein
MHSKGPKRLIEVELPIKRISAQGKRGIRGTGEFGGHVPISGDTLQRQACSCFVAKRRSLFCPA